MKKYLGKLWLGFFFGFLIMGIIIVFMSLCSWLIIPAMIIGGIAGTSASYFMLKRNEEKAKDVQREGKIK